RGPSASRRFCGRTTAPGKNGFPSAHGCWFRLHGFCFLPERKLNQCVVGVELLPYRTADGCWTRVRVHRSGRNDCLTGSFLRRVIETAMDSDILCVLSYHSPVWRKRGRSDYGPLHRAAREASFESPWLARSEWKLDHGHQHPPAIRWTVRKILR